MARRLWLLIVCVVAGALVAGQQSVGRAQEGPSKTPKLAKGVDGTADEDEERGPTLYEQWVDAQEKSKNVPIVRLPSANALEQEVQPWPEFGARGAYLRLLKNQMMDASIIELADANASTKMHKHMYEEYIYVVKGAGSTVVQQQGRHRDTIQWAEGSFFTIPLNAPHQHIGKARVTTRLLSVTSLPFQINITGDAESMYTNAKAFTDRYNAQEDYWKLSRREGNRRFVTNFVKDIRTFEVDTWNERGQGNKSMFWTMGSNKVLGPHISDFPLGYKNGHRHRHEAVIYILNGSGYSLIWQDFGKEKLKVDWKAGSVILVPPFWFHQHFNTTDERVRYLAITSGGPLGRLGLDTADQIMEDEPEIKQLFDQELAKVRAKKTSAAK